MAILADMWVLSHFTDEKSRDPTRGGVLDQDHAGSTEASLETGFLTPKSVCALLLSTAFPSWTQLFPDNLSSASVSLFAQLGGESSGMSLGIRGEERKQNQIKPTKQNSSVLPSESVGASELFLTLLLLAVLLPDPAHPTPSRLVHPPAPEGPPVCPVPHLRFTRRCPVPRCLGPRPSVRPSVPKPSLSRSEVGGGQVGITAAGKEMAVPSSVQVERKIVIFKEEKTGTQISGQPRSPGNPWGRCSDVRRRGAQSPSPRPALSPNPASLNSPPPHLP